MKFSVNQNLLSELLQQAIKFTGKKLGDFLFDHLCLIAESGKLTVRAACGACHFQGSIPVDLEQNGAMTVEAKSFLKLVEALSNTLTLEGLEGDLINLSSQAANYSIVALEGDRVLKISEESYSDTLELNFAQLSEVIVANKFIDSKGGGILSGVCLDFVKGKLEVVATNKHILLQKVMEVPNVAIQRQVVIPTVALESIARMSVAPDTLIQLSFADQALRISGLANDSVLDVRLLDGVYPSVDQLFKTPTLFLSVERKSLLTILNRLALTLEIVSLEIFDGEITLRGSNHKAKGKGIEVLAVESLAGTIIPEKVHLDLGYFRKIVSSFGEDSITLGLTGFNQPMIVSSGNQKTVIMPIQVGGQQTAKPVAESTSYPEPVAA